jgi:hypothetical protein
VQQSFSDTSSKQFFTKSPSVKGLDDVEVKWDMLKLNLMACSEDSEYFLKIFCWTSSA